jgi:hypothetical protein
MAAAADVPQKQQIALTVSQCGLQGRNDAVYRRWSDVVISPRHSG